MSPGMGGVIKQVAHDRLHSLNPAYDDIFPYEDGAKIIGRVLGKVAEEMIPDQDEQALYLEAQENGLQLWTRLSSPHRPDSKCRLSTQAVQPMRTPL